MDQATAGRGTCHGGGSLFSRDDTHLMRGSEFLSECTFLPGYVFRRSGGFSWTTGGDNHKLQGGDHHHQTPARILNAMHGTAHINVSKKPLDSGLQPLFIQLNKR